MKHFRFLISLLATLFYGCGAAPVPADTAESFSIVNWNVETFFDGNQDGIEYSEFIKSDTWGTEAYKVRLKRLCDAIQEMNADVFVMEELENSGIIYDISNQLAGNSWNSKKMYGYGAFAKNEGDAIGCGVISRLPVTEIKIHNLDIRTETDSQPSMRPILEITLKAGEKTVTLFINHWKSKSGREEESEVWRNWQESVLKKLFDEHESEAVLACGDFNRDISEFDLSAESIFSSSPWIKSGGGLVTPGSYYYNNEWERIDHFFANSGIVIGSFQPETDGDWCSENFIPNGYKIYTGQGYSDHLPISCRVNLTH